MTLNYALRPLSDRTWLNPRGRERARFTAGWTDTLELLEREIKALHGRDVVFEIDVREQDIRLDGRLRANARTPETTAVRIAFESKHGPLLYRCDRYNASAYGAKSGHQPWHDNVRAIALTLDALRAVDRYGATETGQQYTGYKALGVGNGTASGMTAVVAKAHLIRVAGFREWPSGDAENRAIMVKRAQRMTHPDARGGDRTDWNLTEQAITTLTRAGALP